MIEDTLKDIEAELAALKTTSPAKKAAIKRKLATLKREIGKLRKGQEKADELTQIIAKVAPDTDPRVLRAIDAVCRELAAIGI